MRNNALSIAYYFVDLAKGEDVELKPLRLMKLVYIAHGFMLALLDRTAIDPRFDKVEAWKYGPVIPSVYHSFKRYGNNPIEEKTVILNDEQKDNGQLTINVITPQLQGDEECKVCNIVWKRYKQFSDIELGDMLHKPGSPWAYVYKEGKNNEIPDLVTKIYYEKVIETILNHKSNG